jgi:hypothetical protein
LRGAEGGGEKKELTSRPSAYLAGMAGQCPRGRPSAAEGRLHRGTTGSTAIGASTGMHSLTEVSSKKHSRRRGRGRQDVEIGGDREAKSHAGSHHGSPRRGGGRRCHLVELVGGAGASDSPKVSAAMVTGDGRSGQAMAAAIQIASELESERRERVRAGLGRFDRPRPEPVGPVGPAGQMG